MNAFIESAIAQISQSVNLNSFDSLNLGDYVSTELGEFIVVEKPNLFNSLSVRRWVFEHTEDADGEPMMNGDQVTIFV